MMADDQYTAETLDDVPMTDEKAAQDAELGPETTYMDTVEREDLPEAHREYLLQRHGTLNLDPLPSADPADPYNWPAWKKFANLMCVAFHTFMCTFIAAGIIPAFADIAVDLHVGIQRASYLTSLQIAVLGSAPLFWKPLANAYGRRPIWLISTIGALVFNIGCAKSKTYGAMAACRAITAFFICPPMAIGSGVVAETFFKKERGKYMGIWTMLVTLGPPGGPFIMGFVAFHVGYRWIYWIFAIINAVQFITYLFLGPETRYMRSHTHHHGSAFKQEYVQLRRIDPKPIRLYDFIQPLVLGRHSSILVPTIAYSIVFGFASVLLTVEIPQIFLPKFDFNPQQLGLQFLGIIVGTIIGEQLSGPLSDRWMNARMRKNAQQGKQRPAPEWRLWLSYFGFACVIIGLIVFGVRTQQARDGHWNISPIIGIAIAAAGNQIVTTVLITYTVDCHPEEAASVGVFVNWVRSTWGFIGPFWFPDMFAAIGIGASLGLCAGLVGAVSVIPIMILQWKGETLRNWRILPSSRREAGPR